MGITAWLEIEDTEQPTWQSPSTWAPVRVPESWLWDEEKD